MSIGETEKPTFDIFNLLTSNPKKEDNFEGIFPVCAPYLTLKKYKYKVKLIPGTLKRGKIVKLV